jgi:hypothetical protein
VYFYFLLKPLFATYDSERLSFYLLACCCVVSDSCINIITAALHLVFSNCKLGQFLLPWTQSQDYYSSMCGCRAGFCILTDPCHPIDQ